eukprot:3381680-Alexandrium_andersonii.AAC.1
MRSAVALATALPAALAAASLQLLLQSRRQLQLRPAAACRHVGSGAFPAAATPASAPAGAPAT